MKTKLQDDDTKRRHVTPTDGNVFADLGFSADESQALLADADRMAMRRPFANQCTEPPLQQPAIG